MNRRGGKWKIFCTWVPHVNNFSPVCMLAKAVYHDKWIKENLEPRAVRRLSKWLSADCSVSVDIYQRVSLLLCMSGLPWWQGREGNYLFGCAEEWVMLKQFILPSRVSLSQRKTGYGNSYTWPEKLATSSIQFNGFQSPMKNTGQREFGNFFICLFFLLSCVCVCVCVCWKLQKKLEGKKLKRNISYKSWIAYSPLTIRCMYFQTFPYVCVIFWKTGMCTILFLFWNLTFFFFLTQHMAL